VPVPMIEVDAVTKRFGQTCALTEVSLSSKAGQVLALLGPNGAGKTTLVRILTTLLRPDSGRARLAGLDVGRQPAEVRSIIGLAGQYASVDELLTGRENLELVGLFYHLPRAEYRRRASQALERMGLTAAGDRTARTYSGGMRRRLDLAASLIARPPVLFLDEPTTGLDPRTRLDLWDLIRELVAGGTTVLLTTQYMDEAERLAHSIVVLDRGHVVAQGTADELKARIAGTLLQVTVADLADLEKARAVLARVGSSPPSVDTRLHQVTVPVAGGPGDLITAGRALEDAGISLADLGLLRPSLNDVFLLLTEHGTTKEGVPGGC
jgi:ABC-2 type transport system ATP-binding protein